jgi:hypothetical protein
MEVSRELSSRIPKTADKQFSQPALSTCNRESGSIGCDRSTVKANFGAAVWECNAADFFCQLSYIP